MKFITDKTFLSNHMFFGDKCNWGDKCTCDVSSYNELASLTYQICDEFHERLCAKILDEGYNYCVMENMRGKHVGSGLPSR